MLTYPLARKLPRSATIANTSQQRVAMRFCRGFVIPGPTKVVNPVLTHGKKVLLIKGVESKPKPKAI